MKTTIHYPCGMVDIEADVRAKLIFRANLKTGKCEREILKTCKGMDAIKAIPYIERIDQYSHNHYSVCYCALIEKALSLETNTTLERLRTITLEKERIYSHLNFLQRMFELAEDKVLNNMAESVINLMLDDMEEITGSRTYSVFNRPQGLNYNFTIGNYSYSKKTNEELVKILDEIKRVIHKSISLRSQYGKLCQIKDNKDPITGPFSWSKINGFDLRITNPYLAYGDEEIAKILHKKQTADSSDAYGRIISILEDALTSSKIIDKILESNKQELKTNDQKEQLVPKGKYNNSIEGPRGKIEFNVEIGENNELKDINIKSPSIYNKQMVASALIHCPYEDIQKAFESLYVSIMEIDC